MRLKNDAYISSMSFGIKVQDLAKVQDNECISMRDSMLSMIILWQQ